MQLIAILAACVVQISPQNPAVLELDNWVPRLVGTMHDGGRSINFESNIKVHNEEATPIISLSLIPIHDITLSVSVYDFSTSSTGSFLGNRTFGSMTLENGDTYNTTIDMTSVGWEAAWDTVKPYEKSDSTSLTFAPIVGLRWYGVENQLENVTDDQSVTHNNSWISLHGGLHVGFDLQIQEFTTAFESISIESQFMAGLLFGDDGGTVWSVRAGVAMRVSSTVSGHIGYRLQELIAEDGAYRFDAGLQGLYFGGELRF
jgi:hypothetical protein